jgi:hypothetical protein
VALFADPTDATRAAQVVADNPKGEVMAYTPDESEKRVIAWFSSGAASAVMTKIALSENPRVMPVQCDLGDSEDEDNRRFTADCEAWFGKPVLRIKSERFANIDEVFESRQYLAGIAGAPCTSEMKVAHRLDFQRPSDLQLWGYTADANDVARYQRMRENYPEMRQRAPLIERGLTKEACLAIIERAGIKPPRVYALGFPNANCIGCVKASSPNYWSLVRKHFPEVFARRANQDDRFGQNRVRINGERVSLSQLPADWPTTDAVAPRCDFLCHIAEQDIAA